MGEFVEEGVGVVGDGGRSNIGKMARKVNKMAREV